MAKLPIGYEKIIEDLESEKWHLLASRSSAPPLPLWLKFPILNGDLAKKLYGTHIPSLGVWENNVFKIYFETAGFKASAKSVSKLLFEPKVAKAHVRKIISLCAQTARSAKFFQHTDISSIPNVELLGRYEKIVRLYAESFLYGYITWCAQVLQWHLLSLLEKKVGILAPLGLTEGAAFGILVKLEHSSPYTKKEKALDYLARSYQSKLIQCDIAAKKIKESFPEIHEAIQSFLLKYQWVGYDYGGPAISYEEVVSQIKERSLRSRKRGISKAVLLKQCRFNKRTSALFEVFSLISYSKDVRNSTDDFVHFCLDNFFNEIGKRHGFSGELARYLWPSELRALIENKEHYSPSYLEQKRKLCAGLVAGGKETFWVGSAARVEAGKISGEEKVAHKHNFIKGISASSGIARQIKVSF